MPKAAKQIVDLARHPRRLTSLDYIDQVFDDFIELHGDRAYGDDQAIVGGIARLGSQAVTVIGIQKGRNLDENLQRHFGQPHPEGYRKAIRLMKQAEKFNRPIVTLINTAGAYPGSGAEERGQGQAIAQNLYEMSQLKVPIIAVITGEGGSGGALALAVGDQVWMMAHSVYSILSPEGFASILWKDESRVAEAAKLMKMTAEDLLGMQVIDRILPDEDVQTLRAQLIQGILQLQSYDSSHLIEMRYDKFRRF